MGAKNANLASDYAPRTVFSVDDLRAQYTATAIAKVPTTKLGVVYLIDSGTLGAGAGGVTYRMRGFDTNGAVNRIVYWSSSNIDTAAVDYTGSAGPVIDVLVAEKIGSE